MLGKASEAQSFCAKQTSHTQIMQSRPASASVPNVILRPYEKLWRSVLEMQIYEGRDHLDSTTSTQNCIHKSQENKWCLTSISLTPSFSGLWTSFLGGSSQSCCKLKAKFDRILNSHLICTQPEEDVGRKGSKIENNFVSVIANRKIVVRSRFTHLVNVGRTKDGTIFPRPRETSRDFPAKDEELARWVRGKWRCETWRPS